MAKLTRDWIATNWSEFISGGEWPPNLYDLSSLDYHVWAAMYERYSLTQPGEHRQAQ